jgi:hypothetical protein
MKAKYIVGAAIVAVLNCTTVQAQVLGGGTTGGLSGSLGGGLGGSRNLDVMSQGRGHGAFDADLDAGSLRRSSRDVADRTSTRARGSIHDARDRKRSAASAARSTATSATDQVRGGAEVGTAQAMYATKAAARTAQRVDTTADNTASSASRADFESGALTSTASAAHDQQLVAKSLPRTENHEDMTSLATESNSMLSEGKPAETAAVPSPSMSHQTVDGSLSKSVSGSAVADSQGSTADAFANSDISATKSERPSANAAAQGSVSATLRK